MEVAALGLSIDSSGVVKGADELDRFTKAANDAGTAADRVGQDSKRGSDGVKRLGDEAKKTEAAFGGFARQARALGAALTAALSVRAIAGAADAWSDMQSRVGAAVRDMEAAPDLMQRMVDIANASYSPLSQTVEIYSRNVTVLTEMGRTAEEAADFTEALNNALVITATRGERAASVQNALSRAMAVGQLNAQNLETVLANGGAVAEALAAELDTNVNSLRALASQGKITSDVIANALIGQFDELRARAEEMPATMEDGFVRIRNNLVALVGTLDQAYRVSERVAEGLLWLADNIGTVARLAGSLVAGFVVYRTVMLASAAATAVMSSQFAIWGGMIAATRAQVGLLAAAQLSATAATSGLTIAFRALTTAIAANPFGAAATALGVLTAAMIAFGNSASEARRKNEELIASLKTLAQVRGAEFQAAMSQARMEQSRARDEVSRLEILQRENRALFNITGGPRKLQEARWRVVELEGAIRSASRAAEEAAKVADTQSAAVENMASVSDAAAGASRARAAAITDEQRAFDLRNERAERFIASLRDEIAQIGLNEQALRALEVVKARDAAATDHQRQQIDELAAARERALAADAVRQDDIVFGAMIEGLRRQRGELHLTGRALDEYRYISDRVLEAQRQGIELTDAQNERIRRQAEEYSGLKSEIAGVADAWGRITRDAARHVADTLEAINAQTEAAREVVGGFFQSWFHGLREGANVFKSFADGVVNGLNRIIDRLLDRTLDSFLDNLIGGSGGFLGSILGSANGNAFGPSGVQQFAKGGAFTNTIVNTPTLFRFANGAALGEMGEAGPEAIMPLKRGPDGSLGVQLHGRAANNNNVSVNNNYNIGGVMTPEAIIAAIRQGGEETLRTVQRQLPTIMQEYDRNGAVAV